MTFEDLKDLFDEWSEAGCDAEGLEAYVFSLENEARYWETELYLMYGFISGYLAAMERTKQACSKAIDILVGADGYVCVHPDEIKNVLVQVEVE